MIFTYFYRAVAGKSPIFFHGSFFYLRLYVSWSQSVSNGWTKFTDLEDSLSRKLRAGCFTACQEVTKKIPEKFQDSGNLIHLISNLSKIPQAFFSKSSRNVTSLWNTIPESRSYVYRAFQTSINQPNNQPMTHPINPTWTRPPGAFIGLCKGQTVGDKSRLIAIPRFQPIDGTIFWRRLEISWKWVFP